METVSQYIDSPMVALSDLFGGVYIPKIRPSPLPTVEVLARPVALRLRGSQNSTKFDPRGFSFIPSTWGNNYLFFPAPFIILRFFAPLYSISV